MDHGCYFSVNLFHFDLENSTDISIFVYLFQPDDPFEAIVQLM
jgi:hypothetical protein